MALYERVNKSNKSLTQSKTEHGMMDGRARSSDSYKLGSRPNYRNAVMRTNKWPAIHHRRGDTPAPSESSPPARVVPQTKEQALPNPT